MNRKPGTRPRFRPLFTEFERRINPAVYLVTNTADAGPGSLRQAIIESNSLAGPDVIEFESGLFGLPQVVSLTSGQITVTDDLTVNGPGAGRLTVANAKPAGPASRVVRIDNPGRRIEAAISGITFTGGKLTGPSNAGGGILTGDESVTLTDVTVTGNESAGRGGGIAQKDDGTLTLIRCTVSGNLTTAGLGGSGGGIANLSGGSVVFRSSTVAGNTADHSGGGVYFFQNGSAEVEGSTISGNKARVGHGGGWYFFGVAAVSPLTFANCTIAGNEAAADGGGIAFRKFTGQVRFQNCTVTDNDAVAGGGGLSVGGVGEAVLASTILSSNRSASNAGPDVIASRPVRAAFSAIGAAGGWSQVDEGNNLPVGTDLKLGPLADNGGPTKTIALLPGSAAAEEGDAASLATDQRGAPRIQGTASDIGAFETTGIGTPTATLAAVPDLLVGGGAGLSFLATYSDDTAVNVATLDSADIRLATPTGKSLPATLLGVDDPSDGPTRVATYSVSAPGGVWDAADTGDYLVELQAGEVTDSGGFAVPGAVLGRLRVRIPAVYTVNVPIDENDGVTGHFDLSLREAIGLANNSPGADVIRFIPGLVTAGSPILLTLGELRITDSVTIEGPPGNVIVDAGGVSRIFNVDDGVPGRSIAVSLSNLIMRGGHRAGASVTDRGGAVFVANETVTMTDCTLRGNVAAAGGGAVSVAAGSGSLVLTRCVVENNLASGAGAAGGAIRVAPGASLLLTQCALSGNLSAGDGGAIYLSASALAMDACTLSANMAANGGGLALVDAGTPIIRICTLSGNAAAGSGGGIHVRGTGSLAITCSTLSANQAMGGPGGGIGRPDGPAVIAVSSSVISGNSALVGADLFSRGLVAVSYSAVGSGDGFVTDGKGNLPFGLPLNLGPLADNGGPTLTHRPAADSPLINAGDNAAGLATDQRGWPRLVGSRADIGSVEVDVAVTTAALTAANVTTAGGAEFTFSVTYEDVAGVDVSKLGTGDVTVTGPGAFVAMPALIAIDQPTPGTPRTAAYSFIAPGGNWDGFDSGDYLVSVNASEVFNTSGASMAARPIGRFQVLIPRNLVVTTDADGGPGSLRNLLAEANAVRGPDTITFSTALFAGGFTRLRIDGGEIPIADAVTIAGPGTNLLAVNAGSKSRLFRLDGVGGAAVFLSDFRLEAGRAAGDGGAVFSANMALTMDRVLIVDSLAESGSGGAIALGRQDASLSLTDCRLTNNYTTGTGLRGDGGAVHAASPSRVTIVRTTLTGNRAADDGGAVSFASGGSLEVHDSTLSGNAALAGRGGAVRMSGETMPGFVIQNSTISGNSATHGGGLAFDAATAEAFVRNSTITGNSSAGSGGGLHVGSSSSVLLTVASSILAANLATSSPDVAGPDSWTLVTNHSLIGALPFTLTLEGWANLTGTLVSPLDPRLQPLAVNGGLTPTHAPMAASPVFDKGSNAAGLTFDQRGAGYPRVVGVAADIGALESAAPPAPPVATVRVNDGSPQRSRVDALTVSFSPAVSFPSGISVAFRLERTGPGVPVVTVPLLVVPIVNSVTIVFMPSQAAPIAGCLIDGNYRLTVYANAVQGPGGELDGNGDGVAGDDLVFQFHRLFGDADGDREVDTVDFAAFRQALGGGTPVFDGDMDGDVDLSDFQRFRVMFGSALP